MNRVICDAIRRRAVIAFTYDGGRRVVEPHCHGVSSAGNEVLRGFQTGGSSGSGEPVGWKLFEVAKIQRLRPQGSTFAAARPGYTPADSAMDHIHCHV